MRSFLLVLEFTENTIIIIIIITSLLVYPYHYSPG